MRLIPKNSNINETHASLTVILAIAITAFGIAAPIIGIHLEGLRFLYLPIVVAIGLILIKIVRPDFRDRKLLCGTSPLSEIAVYTLGAYILIGSIIATELNKEPQSFRPVAIGFAGYLFARTFADDIYRNPKIFLRLTSLTALVFLMLACLFTISGERQPIHEFVYSLIPFGLYLCKNDKINAPLFVVWIILWAVFGGKNTTLIICICSILVFFTFNPTMKSKGVLITAISFCMLTMIGIYGALGVLYLIEHIGLNISTGNTDVRADLYQQLLNKINSSPMVGNAFTNNPTLTFSGYLPDRMSHQLPSHSDLLDIFAHGGIIAGITFLFIIGSSVKTGLYTLWNGNHNDKSILISISSLITLCALIQLSFNPLLMRPSNGFIFWFFLGLTHFDITKKTIRQPSREGQHRNVHA